ncbi:gastrula zinc finger protein XlCGF49.1-like [Penaeus monodon]|uniref:gastrula zinc finger protein XlCGF49.1-like n=1 Tax=Penaeus monodon TaxID=6687 RepID=UPI0018A6F858|nr:gastrula zinc finger protein XlCGF49.1-like [Penaeus monodon]
MVPPLQVEQKNNNQWSAENRRSGEWQDFTSPASSHQCPHCDFVTTSYNKMLRHIQKHTGQKPFSCAHCTYSTTRKALLDEHINTHTGERPFACPYCAYSSSHKSILRVHIRRHTGEKPYACTFCPYRAAQKSTLNSHLMTHISTDVTSVLSMKQQANRADDKDAYLVVKPASSCMWLTVVHLFGFDCNQ